MAIAIWLSFNQEFQMPIVPRVYNSIGIVYRVIKITPFSVAVPFKVFIIY